MKKETLEFLQKHFAVPHIVDIYEDNRYYAVRSNDSSEDSSSNSMAGKFNSKLFVLGKDVPAAKEEILETADDVFVQEMVLDTLYSFVYLKKEGVEILSINNGLCEGLTSGKITGSSFINGVITIDQLQSMVFEPSEGLHIIPSLQSTFSESDVQHIVEYCRKVHSYSEFPQCNIEGTVQDGPWATSAYLLQCREVPLKD